MPGEASRQATGIVTGNGTPKTRSGSLTLPEYPPHFLVECLCGGTLDTRRAVKRDSEAFVGVPCPECGQTWTIEATPEGPKVQAICR